MKKSLLGRAKNVLEMLDGGDFSEIKISFRELCEAILEANKILSAAENGKKVTLRASKWRAKHSAQKDEE